MNTEIQIFNNDQFGQIRTAGTSELPLFCLTDLCKAIGIENNRNVKNRLDEDDVHQMDIGVITGKRTDGTNALQNVSMTFVTESGMYDVILRSDSQRAKPFRKWVTSEVLPAIRKTGGYIPVSETDDEKLILSKAILILQKTIEVNNGKLEQVEKRNQLLTERNQAQDRMLESRSNHIKQMIPSVTFANAVKTSEHSILVGELATIIKQNGVEIGQNRLFAWLRNNGHLMSTTERYNLPTQKAMNMGLFEIKKTTITKPDGTTLITSTPKVTGKGQIYFVNKFLYEENNRVGAEFQRKLELERKGGIL